MVIFDDQLQIRWLYKQLKKQNKLEKTTKIITGFNLINGGNFVRFQTSDEKGLVILKEFLKNKLKFTNFFDDFKLIKMIGKGSFSSVMNLFYFF